MMDESMIKTVIMSPQPDGRIRYSACSSVGARPSQQDTLFVGESPDGLLAVVCDGMGGMEAGERASALGVQMMAESFYEGVGPEPSEYFRHMAVAMDEAVSELEEDGRVLHAGTTIVAVLAQPEGISWLSVGDSRIYLWRGGQMLCPVPAHNYRLLLDERLAAGVIDEAVYQAEEPKAEALISFLGIGGIRRMEISPNRFVTEPGDQVLLCSDGLYKSLDDTEIQKILELPVSPEVKTRSLIDEALERGGRSQDNTSVILLQF